MNITILGSSGRTGVEMVNQALAAGHTVHGLARHDTGADKRPKLHIFVGDATKAEDIAKASDGTDVILSVLGTNSAKSSLMTDAVRAVIEASKKTGVKRFILMSNFAAGDNDLAGAMKLLDPLAKRIFDDKIKSEAELKNSDLDWTIVHATILDDNPLGSGVRVVPKDEKITTKDKIARADVAAWMLGEAQKNAHRKDSLTISR